MSMQTIDKQLLETEVNQRKKFLIRQLAKLEIYRTNDGRKLNDVSLYTLEWTYITAKNEVAKTYTEE